MGWKEIDTEGGSDVTHVGIPHKWSTPVNDREVQRFVRENPFMTGTHEDGVKEIKAKLRGISVFLYNAEWVRWSPGVGLRRIGRKEYLGWHLRRAQKFVTKYTATSLPTVQAARVRAACIKHALEAMAVVGKVSKDRRDTNVERRSVTIV